MVVANACESFVTYQTGRRHISEGCSLNIYHKQDLIPHFYNTLAKTTDFLLGRGKEYIANGPAGFSQYAGLTA
jgi:hypothetical protein